MILELIEKDIAQVLERTDHAPNAHLLSMAAWAFL